MKKITNLLLAASVIAFAASCNKEIEQETPDQTGKVTVLTAHVDNGIKTRTTLDDVNVVWSNSDEITAFNSSSKFNSQSTTVSEGGAIARFTFGEGAQNLIYALYPKDDNAVLNNGTITTTIPTEQDAVANSFANGAALAIAKVTDPDDIHFKNAGGLIAFKINAPNHNIVSMTLSATEAMTGQVAVSINASDVVTTQCSGENYVTVTGSFTSDNFYYAVIAPGTYSNVTITFTDSDNKTATYTKDANLVVERNDHLLIGAFSPEDERWQEEQTDVYYEKVTSSDGLENGQYLIVYEAGPLAFNGGLTTLDAENNGFSVTISDNKIPSSQEIDAKNFTISVNNNSYTIKSASGYYIGNTTNSNGIDTNKSTEYSNTISIDASGNATIISSGGAYLRFNNSANAGMRFRYYKSSSYASQKPIALYKRSSSAPAPVVPEITFTGSDTRTMGIGTKVCNIQNVKLLNKRDNNGITATIDPAVNWIQSVVINGDVTSESGATVTVTASGFNTDIEDRTCNLRLTATGAQERVIAITQTSCAVRAPSDLTATPGNGSFTVTWTADNHVNSYKGFYSTTQLDNPEQGGTRMTIGTGENSTTVNGVVNGTKYYVYVKADELKDESNGKYVIADEWASVEVTPLDPSAERTATILFGNGKNNTVKINSNSATGEDSLGNEWTITTVGTNSFTPNGSWAQIGSGSNPATSITFSTTFDNSVTVKSMSAKFGGYGGTAGDIALKVDDTTIGTGSLNGTNDVIVNSSSTASGTVLTVTVTNISKGVNVYYITVTYY